MNNDILNLKAVFIEEHLQIHLSQKDWGAVKAILMRMGGNDELKREASRNLQIELLEKNVHNFQKMPKSRRTEISKKGIETCKKNKIGFYKELPSEERLALSSNAGKVSKMKKAGFHDPLKTGGRYVEGTLLVDKY